MTERTLRRAALPGLLGGLLAAWAALVLLVADVVLYSRNTLFNHPEWINTKQWHAYPAMGVVEAFETRNLLQGDRLNLQAWHGFNELLLNRVTSLGSLGFDFRLSPGAYVDAILDRTFTSFSAVRLSRHPELPSGFLRAEPDGRFTAYEALPGSALSGLSGGWHRAELRSTDGLLGIRVDGIPVGEFRRPAPPRQVVGFRSGLAAAAIDDVVVTDATGAPVWREDFRNARRLGEAVGSFALGSGPAYALLLGAAGLAGLRSRWRHRVVGTLATALYGHFLALVLLAGYAAFDRLWWSGCYTVGGDVPWGSGLPRPVRGIERARGALFRTFAALDSAPHGYSSASRPEPIAGFLSVAPREAHDPRAIGIVSGEEPGRIRWVPDTRRDLQNALAARSLPGEYRVLLAGTSQTWGAGAQREDEVLPVQLQAQLARRAGAARPVTVVAASIPGSVSSEIAGRCRRLLGELVQPHLVVVNLGHNDPDPRLLRESVGGLTEWNAARGVPTLLVLEAVSQEFVRTRHLRGNHQALIEVASSCGAAVLDLHGALGRPEVYRSGYLWWDLVHLTSYGQRAAAERIAEAAGSVAGFPAGGGARGR